MKLNHVNLTVGDVPGARRFLERHFGMRPYGEGHKNFDVLFDDDDLVLTLIGVGFIQPDEASVDEINYVEAPGGFTIEVLC